MADTFGSPVVGTAGQFQGLFNEVYTATGTVTDQDVIAVNDTATFSVTVTGAALGDFVFVSMAADLSDGTDILGSIYGVVTAANTVAVRLHADVGTGGYATDDLNGVRYRVIVCRPAFP